MVSSDLSKGPCEVHEFLELMEEFLGACGIFVFCTPKGKIDTSWSVHYILAPMLWVLGGMEVLL